MSKPELPRQTKPAAKIPEKNAQKHEIPEEKTQKRAHPYDDAFRTLLKTCSPLILPVINEMFGEHYTGKEVIDFHSEQQRLNKQNGKGEWRITDSTFTVRDAEATPKHYLLEVQSTADNSMLVRVFEYSTLAALAAAELTRDALHVTIPHSGILFLRSTGNTPDRMEICIDTPGGAITFDVQVLKTQEYNLDEIFEKDLLMLIPFYIFSHEDRFNEYNTNEEKLRELQNEYRDIIDRLKGLKKSKHLTEYQYRMLIDMSRSVLEYIAAKYDNVKEGVGEFMGGNIIETEATRIFNEGIQQGETIGETRGIAIGETRGIAIGETRGIAIGETRGKVKTALNLHARGDTPASIADVLEVDVTEVQKWIRKGSKSNRLN